MGKDQISKYGSYWMCVTFAHSWSQNILSQTITSQWSYCNLHLYLSKVCGYSFSQPSQITHWKQVMNTAAEYRCTGPTGGWYLVILILKEEQQGQP